MEAAVLKEVYWTFLDFETPVARVPLEPTAY